MPHAPLIIPTQCSYLDVVLHAGVGVGQGAVGRAKFTFTTRPRWGQDSSRGIRGLWSQADQGPSLPLLFIIQTSPESRFPLL